MADVCIRSTRTTKKKFFLFYAVSSSSFNFFFFVYVRGIRKNESNLIQIQQERERERETAYTYAGREQLGGRRYAYIYKKKRIIKWYASGIFFFFKCWQRGDLKFFTDGKITVKKTKKKKIVKCCLAHF